MPTVEKDGFGEVWKDIARYSGTMLRYFVIIVELFYINVAASCDDKHIYREYFREKKVYKMNLD